jgi:predicted glycoside hydrolase/deacetylase ChbG (UPF0249 family)
MARATASEEAITMATNCTSLGVGCHVVLVDGEPVLPLREIPTLADGGTGRFHSSLGAFLGKLLLGHIRSSEIEAEAAAQITLLRERGLSLAHIDSHKHTHMFPAVLRPLLRAARSAGVGAVRNPFEPAWSRRVTPAAFSLRRMEVSLLSQLEPAFRRIVAEEGITTTDGSLGVLATGTLDARTVNSLLKSIPPGTWELVTHPGYNDADLARTKTRLKQSRETERQALLAVGNFAGLDLINFAKLAADTLKLPQTQR